MRPRGHFKTLRAWLACNTKFAEKKAGVVAPRGYRVVGINGGLYRASRIAVKWMTGEEPPETVDHCDTDPTNERWENLRPATHQEQSWNRRTKANSSGYRGVRQSGAGWTTQWMVDGTTYRPGSFSTAEEAAAVYEAEARRRQGVFYREPKYAASLKALTPKRRPSREPASGFTGVTWHRQGRKWRAGIFMTAEPDTSAFSPLPSLLVPLTSKPKSACTHTGLSLRHLRDAFPWRRS